MGIKRLNGMDAMLVYSETSNLHTHTLKVLIVDASAAGGRVSVEHIRRVVACKLPSMPPLRCRLVPMPWRVHHPVWQQVTEIDLDYHVRRVHVAAPGGRRELDDAIGRIASVPLDRNRPLWEFHVAEGLADGRMAIIGKVHHSLADGLASVNLLNRLVGLADGADDCFSDQTPCAMPSRAVLLRDAARDHVRQIAGLPALISDAVRGAARVRKRAKGRPAQPEFAKLFDAPPTFLNHPVSPGRTFASASLPLHEVKGTARHLGVTFNDVVLAIATGALRELLLRYDGRADRPLLATVPVSTDRSPDRVSGNEISGLTVSLPVHVDDPLQRVSLLSTASAYAKEDHELLGPTLQGRLMALLPAPIAPALFRRQSKKATNTVMNVAVSTVPGPRVHGTICGAPVTEMYSVGILSAGSAFNVTAWSYVERVDIAVLSDDNTFNDVHEATDAMVQAFGELRRAAGFAGDSRNAATRTALAQSVAS
jgi:diacylglycerol O-acyltransferase